MDERERELNSLRQQDEMPMGAWSTEVHRLTIQRHLTLCFALVAAPRDEFPELAIVRSNRQEMMKVFPSGKLPVETLQPNTIYETELGSKRRVRYLTTYQWGNGEKFVVFTREP